MMRSVVLIHGALRGMGYESECAMLAMKEAAPPEGCPVYTRCSVIETTAEVPDGDYTVFFSGCSVPVRRQQGLWLPGEAPFVHAA